MEVGHLNEKQIAKKALNIRVSIIKMLEKAKSGHAAGPLGLADIFAVQFIQFGNDGACRDAHPLA